MDDAPVPYDAFLLVSFGGPEGADEVMPFLENVLRGKRVPRERMLEVAEHYQHFDGISPINQQNRELLAAIQQRFQSDGIDLPLYWGNRNWHPLLPDTLAQMARDGRKRALAFFTSMFSSYSGCRQYRENIRDAQAAVGPAAPQVEKLRFAFNHPGFIEPMVQHVREGQRALDVDGDVPVLFTAHSIPMSMADYCSYERQLRESCRLIAGEAGLTNWDLVYQSRSGPPQQPWLEPDVCDVIAERDAEQKMDALLLVPVGFVSDHMEVIYDLDDEAAELCQQRGIRMHRCSTVGTHPQFVEMIAELVKERLQPGHPRRALGDLGCWHDVCPADCCQYNPTRPK
ncbi:ferrochelatase [Roseimaritima sediminicola]|uniref:ferrochelatase n=1 Tax=Roseimaritima sediminicola TaxID=2662066 RepID=UPI00129842A4|nr:ferrochelatase [Roseimaritima sediminicola]